MKSLIKFIEEESKRRGSKLSTQEIRSTIEARLDAYKSAIDELEDLKAKTYHYDDMEKILEDIKNDKEVLA